MSTRDYPQVPVSTCAYAVTFAAVSFLAALSICTAFERDGLRWSPARELVAQVLRSTKEYYGLRCVV